MSRGKPLAALPPPALGGGGDSAPFSCPEREMGLTEASQWDEEKCVGGQERKNYRAFSNHVDAPTVPTAAQP